MRMLLILQTVQRVKEWQLKKVKEIMKQAAVADDDPVTWEPHAVMSRSVAAKVYICIYVLYTHHRYLLVKSQHLSTGE